MSNFRGENNGRQRPDAGMVDDKTRIRPANGASPQNGDSPPPLKKKKKPKLLAGTVVGMIFLNLLKAFFVVMCLGLIVGSVVAVQAVQYVVEATSNDENILDLETYSTNQTSFFYAMNPDNPNAEAEEDYIAYQELVGAENRIWVSYTEFPEDLINAVIATEDRQFYEHHGVDFRRTIGALANEVLGFQDQFGASTITQQLVKNITQEDEVEVDGDMSAGYLRKLREIFRAWGLENRYSKEQIMEAYLNTIGLSERIAGVEAGAQNYFNKSVSELTLAECATIAGITQAPTYFSPFQNPDNALERRNDVIAFMLDSGFITEAEAQEVWDMPDLGLASAEEVAQNEAGISTTGVFSWASDKAFNDVIADLMEQKGMSYEAARDYLYNGGLRVYLTVDLNVQQALDDIMINGYEEDGFFMDEERFPGYTERLTQVEDLLNGNGQKVGEREVLPQAAVAVVNYQGELIATSGGIGEKTGSLEFNRSIDGARQNGSTMKPVAAYALGIDYGLITYSRGIMETGVQPRDPYNPSVDEDGNVVNDWPSNAYRDGYRNVLMPIVSAVAESTNTVAARVGMMVGVEQMYEFMVDTLEISTLVEPNDVALGPLVLGSLTEGISPYELAGAFAMFGGDEEYGYGTFVSLHSYTKVTDSKGNIILQPQITPKQAIKPESGYIMNRLLSTVLHQQSLPLGVAATASGLAPEGEMPSVAKTGTTSDDLDRWFVGLTPYYVTAVWWGYDNNGNVKHDFLEGGGKGWSPASRTNIPGNLWKTLMENVQADLPYRDFPEQPEGIQELQFCTATGDLYQAGCPGSMTGYYADFALPSACQGHSDEDDSSTPA